MRMSVSRMLECAQLVVPRTPPKGEEGLCIEQRVTMAINKDMINRGIPVEDLITFKCGEGIATYWYRSNVKNVKIKSKKVAKEPSLSVE
jgi:hypothetical protein